MRSLISLFLSLAAIPALACTNLIAGRGATVDGSVICTYNSDAFDFAGHMEYYPAGRHAADETVAIPTWLRGFAKAYIPQVEYTYKVVGLMNENQVSITETTFDGRLELVDPESLMDYYTLMQLGLQRARTAREALQIVTSLAEEYGYNSSGETFSICDKQEAWILEMMGKGPGGKGAVWVAMRVPDDCITAHANLSRIRQFPLNDPQNCLYSKDVISFAREKGYFSGKDKNFSFRDAYCPIDFENVRYADARVYSFFRHHADAEEMDQYLPYVNGEFDRQDHLPLWIKPKQKVSVRDMMNDMRDHFEGTPLDMTADVSAGPWASPVRPLPMHYQDSEGNDYFRERPIAVQQTAYAVVCQMRSWLPDDIGGICYFNCDDANMVVHVPVFCCVNRVPEPLDEAHNPQRQFSAESAFWMNNFVANMVYPRYSMMIGDVREAQQELEDFYQQDIAALETELAGKSAGERVDVLTARSAQYAARMMQRWDELSKLLIVKYNDQVVLPSENGKISSGRIRQQGYERSFVDVIGRETGDRYRLKKVIERRER